MTFLCMPPKSFALYQNMVNGSGVMRVNMTMKFLFVVSALVASACMVQAQTTAMDGTVKAPLFQASLTPDAAVQPRTTQINGLCLNLWGENPQHALALGLVNGSTGDSQGLTWSVFNYADSYTGVAWGLVNYSKTNFVGWQGGVFFCPCLVNVAQGRFLGLQEAAVNYGEDFHGVQLGVVNYANQLDGVQIGLVNIARNNSWFHQFPDKLATGFPLVNWSF